MVTRKTFVGSLSKIPETSLIGQALSAATNTIYTCPAGKKAVINGIVYLDNYGAAGIVSITVNGVGVLRWWIQDSDGTTGGGVPLQTNRYKQRELVNIQLAAGQAIAKTQDVGDNATLNYNIRIQELPA